MYLATLVMNVFMKLDCLSCHHVAVSTAQQGGHRGKTARNTTDGQIDHGNQHLEVLVPVIKMGAMEWALYAPQVLTPSARASYRLNSRWSEYVPPSGMGREPRASLGLTQSPYSEIVIVRPDRAGADVGGDQNRTMPGMQGQVWD